MQYVQLATQKQEHLQILTSNRGDFKLTIVSMLVEEVGWVSHASRVGTAHVKTKTLLTKPEHVSASIAQETKHVSQRQAINLALAQS